MDIRDKRFLLGFLPQFRSLIVEALSPLIAEIKKDKPLSVKGTVSVKGEVSDPNLQKSLDELVKLTAKPVAISGVVDTKGETQVPGLLEAISNLEQAVRESSYKGTDAKQAYELLSEIKKAIGAIKISVPKITIPKPDAPVVNVPEFKLPPELKVKDIDLILEALSAISAKLTVKPSFSANPGPTKLDTSRLESSLEEVKKAVENIKIPVSEFKLPETLPVHIMGTEVVQKTPPPVTHISINSLSGVGKSSSVTIGTMSAELPRIPLPNRRSLMVYNNSSETIYLGGVDVSASNGLPLPPGSYSPSFDMGEKMTLYAVADKGNNDIRVFEISDEKAGR